MRNHYDLIVVGTSFASSFFLKKYLEKSPATNRVLVLERGSFYAHKERLKVAREKPFGDNSYISSLGRDGRAYITNNKNKPWIFDPNFGGNSNCWTGCTPRFMPSDFKMKTLYGIGEDWPVSYDELEPYYVEAEKIMDISGPSGTPYPMSKPYPLPPHRLSTVDKMIQKEYGDLYISQPAARASVPTKNRNACCTSAICHLCPVDAKFTIENGLKYLYEDPRVELLTGAQALSLSLENNNAKGVLFRHENIEKEAKADAIALGANALFNAHILLNSGDTNIYTGKGISEQVGYYAYLYLDGLENVGGSSTITANGFMLYDGMHRKEYAACLIESHNDAFIRGEFGKWRQLAKFKFVFEDLPQDANYVMPSSDRLKPEVYYKTHSAYAKKGYDALKKNIDKLFGFLPLEKIELDSRPQLSESHILGTTRMGSAVENSVVDKNLLHHQYRNVFVLGGGAFPTISASNPTLTLAGLSLMAANNSF